MLNKITSAPWKAEKETDCSYAQVRSYNDKLIAAPVLGIDAETRDANAALIAAAPELYEKLDDFVREVRRWRESGFPSLTAFQLLQDESEPLLKRAGS